VPSSRDGQRLTFSRRIGSLATATLAIIITGGCGGSSQQIPKLQSINISPATALINVGEPANSSRPPANSVMAVLIC